jgi:Ca2+-transporting ATPase
MVTGDHSGTASSIAREVGLPTDEGRVVHGDDLREGGAIDLDRVAVYARVLPGDKVDIVRSFQARGEVVAVTGDGVNDAPALRQADIGVAMGRTGSDVAREAADMVLTNDDLDTIVHAVEEGRHLFGNIRKVVDYLVAGNLSEVAVVIVALVAFPAAGAVLTPLQLLWINLLTDGLPAVALGVAAPADAPAQAQRPRSGALLSWGTLRILALRAVAIAGASLGTLVLMRFAVDTSWETARTAMFTVLVLAHLLYGLVVWLDRPGDRPAPIRSLLRARGVLVAIGVGLVLQVAIVAIPPAHQVLYPVGHGGIGWALSAAAAAAAAAAVRSFSTRP